MVKTKTTPHGSSSSHRPRGMATARFTSTEADVEQQLKEVAGEETEDSQDWLDMDNPKAVTQGETSKSEGKTGDQPQQAEEGAEAPSEEIPPAPEPTDPKPGTSKDPTSTPVLIEVITQDPTQTTPQGQEEEAPVNLTEYVKSYQQAGKVWLDTVLEKQEEAYTTLFDMLLQLGDPHIDNFENADSQQVFKCIKDRTGRFLSKDEFAIYVELEEAEKKPKYRLTGDARCKVYPYRLHA